MLAPYTDCSPGDEYLVWWLISPGDERYRSQIKCGIFINQITVLHTVFHKMGCGEVFDFAALILKHIGRGFSSGVFYYGRKAQIFNERGNLYDNC